MPVLRHKDRFLRILPGRIRMEICGLQHNNDIAELLIQKLSALEGIYKIEPCVITGRLLLLYDEKRVAAPCIFAIIDTIESQGVAVPEIDVSSAPRAGAEPDPSESIDTRKEIAAAIHMAPESEIPAVQAPAIISDSRKWAAEKIPIPLALSMGGLALLGVKQLFMGRSALARSPAPFYLSAFVSVITGYPFLKRGIRAFSADKKINSDLVLGASSLALALIRENLVVLAGLSLLQYVNWKRSSSVLTGQEPADLSPEIQRYSEISGKLGIVAAGVTWAVTRNPLRAIAVLLAANPRPMTLPAQYAWNQAELVSEEKRYVIPEKGSLSRLARTKTVLIEDSSLLFHRPQIEEMECITDKQQDADKIICLAASLMEKSNHPWKDEVYKKAKQTCRTIRTAFHVAEDQQGIQGKLNDSRIVIGSCKYLQEHGIDCDLYELKAKRVAKKGYDVLFVGKHTGSRSECLGFIARQQQSLVNEYTVAAASLAERGWQLGLLHNSLNINEDELASHHLDTGWLSLEAGEVLERTAALHQSGEDVLFVAAVEENPLNRFYKEAGLPSISVVELNRIRETALFAEGMDRTVHQHAKITKKWNMIGSVLATLGMLSAPAINLAGDALTLLFMSRAAKKSEVLSFPQPLAHHEIAVTSEAYRWHALPSEHVMGTLHSNMQTGLASDCAVSVRNQYGLNRLEGKKTTPWLLSYLGQFKEFTTLILTGTTALALFTGGLFDGIAMGVILLANAAIGTMQERKAEKVVESLNQFQAPVCKVLRDNREFELSAEELVPGDIVCLEAGDRIPADIRLLSSWNLRVNEAPLTGESHPIEKNESVVAENCSLTERTNMLFMGTDVCGGRGKGIVVHTGMNTEMGHLMSLLKQQERDVTPLQEKVTSISKKFVKGALAAGGIIFVVGLLRGIPVPQMVSTALTLTASAIPEGLPVTITIALSAGIFRMAKKHALIRKLSSLETLGRTTVICTDKTGTLTKNEMTVKTLSTTARSWNVTGNGYEPSGALQERVPEVAASAAMPVGQENQRHSANDPDLNRMLQICLLCNNSQLEQQEDQWIIKGDPTEGALLTLAAKNGLWLKDMSHWHRGLEIPFDSNTAKMSVVCKDLQSDQECYLFSKGAVESILRHCSRYQKNGDILPLTEEQKQLILRQNESFSADALRVLAFAYRPVDGNAKEEDIDDERELIYVGMAGMMDPPKPELEHHIREAVALGVKPVMITGDHPITAIAIAKQLGIYNGMQNVISGHELDRLTNDELVQMADQISIFARVTPEHKLRIITAFQKRGHIVAMTGDGINDTPAIKQANIGIAMGRTGTEVTKQAADMVLTEDHFGTIVDGVKEGRTIIGNIRKALGCLLTGNLAEIIVTSAAVIIGLPIPLVPIQILLMNLLTDALPAMVLAVNPGNKTKLTKRTDIVDQDLYRKVITRGVLLGLGSVGLFAASRVMGLPVPVGRSIAFATLVAGQLLQTFSWRQEGSEEKLRDWTKDRFLLGALGISWLALLGTLYIPPLAGFFHTAPLPLAYWIPILGVAGSVSLISKSVLALLQAKPAIGTTHTYNPITAA